MNVVTPNAFSRGASAVTKALSVFFAEIVVADQHINGDIVGVKFTTTAFLSFTKIP
jgi:hypothetical protein